MNELVSLDRYAALINGAIPELDQHKVGALEVAFQIGDWLLEAKANCAHGEFLSWRGEAVLLDKTQCQTYQKLSGNVPKGQRADYLEEAKSIRQGLRLLGKETGAPDALQSSDSNEWYTPEQFIDAARGVMGSIDLDPASSLVANERVKAEAVFSKEDDGYSQEWWGNVWLNPPYGREGGQSNQQLWVNKLVTEFSSGRVTQACLLVNAVPGNAWFLPLWEYMICFVYRRIRFHEPSGEQGQPTHSNVIVYMGENRQEFINIFSAEGAVVERLSPDVI